MVSLSPGVRTTLSGPETKSMTHYLRRHHDAILIGVGTAVTDDPSLNCRYPGGATQPALQPAILDPILRWNAEESKVAALAREGKGKRPWIITTAERATSSQQPGQVAQYLPIDNEGLQILQANEPSTSRRLRWQSILEGLKRKGVNSVMIEGGATVINDLLSEPYLVDSVIVTIAPTWLGQGGTVVSPAPKFASGVRANAARLQETSWRQFGQDVVLCGRLR
jgi:2,5-diamino-6-(ribosylamino)-4(3H)-pyrimidinone 5'-phosphate reductase